MPGTVLKTSEIISLINPIEVRIIIFILEMRELSLRELRNLSKVSELWSVAVGASEVSLTWKSSVLTTELY